MDQKADRIKLRSKKRSKSLKKVKKNEEVEKAQKPSRRWSS
jgi:hypothetical protein